MAQLVPLNTALLPALVVERDGRGGWRTPEFAVDLHALEKTLPHDRDIAMPTARSRKERGEAVAGELRRAMAAACGIPVRYVEMAVRQDPAAPNRITLVTLTARPTQMPRAKKPLALDSGPVVDI